MITYIFGFSTISATIMYMLTSIMSAMSSVERLVEYNNYKIHEKPWEVIEEDSKYPDWPRTGDVDIKDLKIRYRKGLDLVIKGVDLRIEEHQKVGIVGRTGSGKSTFMLSLMRILEMAKESRGYVKISNVDISKIGLHKLRKAITIIPQDPYLFKGTLRSNVDPFDEYSSSDVIEGLNIVEFFSTAKEELFDVLRKDEEEDSEGEKSLLKKKLTMADKLELPIEQRGSNISLGQRQLICIARALIKKPKILLMDEATANIDQRTDEIIQKVISHDMPNTTVITIAHRLNTIIQYDKIVVLEEGKKVEEGNPLELMEKGEIFYQMVEEGGEEFKQKMLMMAREKFNKRND